MNNNAFQVAEKKSSNNLPNLFNLDMNLKVNLTNYTNFFN